MLDLNRIIRETATWIYKVNVDFETNYYRSDQLKPLSCNNYYDLHFQEFHKLIAKRSIYLKDNNIALLGESEVSKLGKLIWSDPDETEHDGGAEAYSQGLYDISECPPWDTWIAKGNDFDEFKHLGNVVISWLPNQHFNKFYSGKAVSIRDNMDWLIDISSGNAFFKTIIGVPSDLTFEEKSMDWNVAAEQNNQRWL